MADELLSLDADTFEQGGFLDGMEAVITGARWIDDFDYDGKLADPVLALLVVFQVDQDGKTKEWPNNYSAGDPSRVRITNEGYGLTPLGRTKALRSNTNAGRFLAALKQAGWTPTPTTQSIEGLRVRLEARAYPGLERPLTVVAEILDAAPTRKTTRASKADAPARRSETRPSTKAGNGEARDTATSTILHLLAEHGQIPKAKLPQMVFEALDGDAQRNAAFQLAFQDSFLKSVEFWTFDGKTIKMSAE